MRNIINWLFPLITWRIKTEEKVLFLTFDDGPEPEATPSVLEILSMHHAKATFFCIGDNIRKNPEIFTRIKKEGHAIGNHTYNHLNGWQNSRSVYLKNVEECEVEIMPGFISDDSGSLFRPPYGKLKFSQYAALKKKNKIVMWDVLTRDWEEKRSAESCFARVKSKAGPGSIIVFHDSIKARIRMLPALEETLNYFTGIGYRFESLNKYV